MKEIGLEDFDMKVLDEDDFEFKDIQSSKSSPQLKKSSPAVSKKYPLSEKDFVSPPPNLEECKDT